MGSKLLGTQTLKFYLPGAVVPKARPRVTRNGSYLPERYRNWRQTAEGELLLQLSDRSRLPLDYPVAIQILLQGKGHRGDIDNMSGSVLDAMVACGILQDDRLSCVPRLLVEHHPAGESGCFIEIEAMVV